MSIESEIRADIERHIRHAAMKYNVRQDEVKKKQQEDKVCEK